MSLEGQNFYPGEAATPVQIVLLADEYRSAAEALRPLGRRGVPLSRSPFRLVAIHAIELYLNAALLHAGHSPSRVRGLQHDLAERTQLVSETGIILRKSTVTHLESLSSTREYLVSRYDPDLAAASQLNRLSATLDEVATKVNRRVRLAAMASPAKVPE